MIESHTHQLEKCPQKRWDADDWDTLCLLIPKGIWQWTRWGSLEDIEHTVTGIIRLWVVTL